jgi:hypothetical protein
MNKNCLLRYRVGRLMFNQTPDPEAGGGSTPPGGTTPPAPTPPAGSTPNNVLDGETFDFPANTPLTEMTPEQRAEYWRKQSKQQQKIADGRKDYDAIKTERDTLVATHSTDEDKAIADAKTAGAAEATTKLLKTAVRGHLRALTGRPVADIDKALEFVDVTKFTGESGDLDDVKLNDFAGTLGTGAPGNEGTPPIDPVREALDRQQRGGPPTGGSIAAQEELEYQRLTGKGKQ